MGTSKSYDAPGSWGPIKREVTVAAKAGAVSQDSASQILRSFVGINGGADRIARGLGSGGTVGGAAGKAVAQRLGAFISSVGGGGLAAALDSLGLAGLVGRPIHELLAGLLDRLGGAASTIDAVDARTALAALQGELMAEAKDVGDVERVLQGMVTNLEEVLTMYFGIYLYEQFCRVFFERLAQRVGEQKARSFLSDIRAFIGQALANRMGSRTLAGVDWAGAEGRRLSAEIMKSTLEVFTV